MENSLFHGRHTCRMDSARSPKTISLCQAVPLRRRAFTGRFRFFRMALDHRIDFRAEQQDRGGNIEI